MRDQEADALLLERVRPRSLGSNERGAQTRDGGSLPQFRRDVETETFCHFEDANTVARLQRYGPVFPVPARTRHPLDNRLRRVVVGRNDGAVSPKLPNGAGQCLDGTRSFGGALSDARLVPTHDTIATVATGAPRVGERGIECEPLCVSLVRDNEVAGKTALGVAVRKDAH